MCNKPQLFPGRQFLFIGLIGYACFVASCYFVDPFKSDNPIYESPVFATASEARKHVGTPLPDEAVNIQLASYREWIAAEDYLQFEAPVEVCLEHAAKLFPNLQLAAEPIPEYFLPFPKNSHFQDLSWFDLGKAGSVLSVSQGNKTIFIDQERGVFYYHMTD